MATEAEIKAAQEAQAKADAEAAAKAAADEAARKAAAAGTGSKKDPPPDLSKAGLYLPPNAVKKMKEAEQAKGRAAFKAELDGKAQAKGFKDFDAWLSHAPAGAAAAAAVAASDAGKGGKPADDGKGDKDGKGKNDEHRQHGQQGKGDRRLARELEDERRARQKSDRKARDLEQRLQAREARAQLEREFILDGVKDVDYAISLLERETATMSAEDAEKFDERAWLAKLRTDRPYLFGEAVRPIDTTGSGSAAPGAGKAGNVQPGTAGAAGAAGGQPGDRSVVKNALEVDPKTGKYVMSEIEKNRMLQDILKTANQPGPLLGTKN